METQELFERLQRLRAQEGWTIAEICSYLKVTHVTFNNWKNGGKISSHHQVAIMALTAGLKETPAAPSCPFLDIIHSRWGELTTAERAEIAGKVASLADLKKDSSSMEEA